MPDYYNPVLPCPTFIHNSNLLPRQAHAIRKSDAIQVDILLPVGPMLHFRVAGSQIFSNLTSSFFQQHSACWVLFTLIFWTRRNFLTCFPIQKFKMEDQIQLGSMIFWVAAWFISTKETVQQNGSSVICSALLHSFGKCGLISCSHNFMASLHLSLGFIVSPFHVHKYLRTSCWGDCGMINFPLPWLLLLLLKFAETETGGKERKESSGESGWSK